jgi:hypothetical protein
MECVCINPAKLQTTSRSLAHIPDSAKQKLRALLCSESEIVGAR